MHSRCLKIVIRRWELASHDFIDNPSRDSRLQKRFWVELSVLLLPFVIDVAARCRSVDIGQVPRRD